MRLFDTAKVPVYVTKIDHNTERRTDGEVQVLVLSCRIQPFDHKLASSMDQMVRASLFKLTGDGDPHPHVQGFAFSLPIERQDLTIFATPDTKEASIRIEQVKVSRLKAKLEKGSHAFVASFCLTHGPVSARELEYWHAVRTKQIFITFGESEPDLAYEEVGSGSTDEDEEEDDTQPALPEPMWDDDKPEPVGVGAEKADRKQHKPISHASRKKGKKR